MRVRAVLILLAAGAVCQTGPEKDEQAIREVLGRYMRAARAGDYAEATRYFRDDTAVYTSGGARLGMSLIRRGTGLSFARGSNLIRHVQFPAPETAVAVGLWRDVNTPPPYDAGASNHTLVKSNGVWKVASVQNGFLRSPDSFPVPRIYREIRGEGVVTGEERAAGWMPLFDGKTNAGWLGMDGRLELPSCWRIEDGSFTTVAGQPQMAIRTERNYLFFELSFEWKVPAKANSGVKYRIYGTEIFERGRVADGAGYEYQVADDDGDPGAIRDPKQKSGAIYGVTAVRKSQTRPVGEWNQSRVIVRADHVEHWLNGVKTAEMVVDAPFASPISLQHHETVCSFRKLKIRVIQ